LIYCTLKIKIKIIIVGCKIWKKIVRSQNARKMYLLQMCLNSFHSEGKLKDHKIYCGAYKHVRIEMSAPYDNILQFKHCNYSLKVPFVSYADFECMLQIIQSCQTSDETAYMNAYQIHVPNNFAYYLKYCKSDYKPPVEYPGMDAPKYSMKNERRCIENSKSILR
jgi:hypothetical protein